jgi:dTDP-4-dehydrorhamnose reductase
LRILLTGRNGQVGWELKRALPTLGEVIATDRSSLDLADPDAIRRRVRETRPDIIVNAAAYTAVDSAEHERRLAIQVNAVAPRILAEEAKRLGALLVHYSTDYVFDGTKRTPYVESDAPNPLSHYATTKLEGERAISANGGRYLVLRTSWVYGPRASNFYQLIRKNAAANKPMKMVDDQISVPSTSEFVAAYTVALLKKNASGLFHLVPSGQATRYEFALAVVRSCGSRSSVERALTADFPSAARRPARSVLDNRKMAGIVEQPVPHWQELLRTVGRAP